MITAPPSTSRTISTPRMGRVIAAACIVLAFCGVARAQNASFTPNSNSSVVQTATTSSAHYALPGIGTGAADIVWNTGGSRLYFKFGDTSVVATANDVPLDPNCWMELAPGQNQNIGVVTGTGTAGVTIVGGSGLATGSGCSSAGSAPSGTQDVNLKQVGGSAVTAGQVPVTPATRTLVTLNVKTVTTGGVPVVALLAGQRSAGGWLQNPSTTVSLGINEIGAATGTTSSGDTTFIAPGASYQLAPSGNAVSVISSDSSHPFSGMGFQ